MLLEKNVTYLITKENQCKTFYKTQVKGNKVNLLVYDRTHPSGLSIIKTNQINSCININSFSYAEELKEFIKFLYDDLQYNIELYSYIIAIWNNDIKSSQELYDENCCLPEYMEQYLSNIIISNRYYNIPVVLYFYEVFYMQELLYDKYSEEWLEENRGFIKEFINIPSEDI